MNLGDDDLQLLCIIEGETVVFPIDVEASSWRNPKFMVGHLKEKIQEERKYDSLAGVDTNSLVLWKPKDTNPIDVNLDDLASIRSDEQMAEKLCPARPASYIFPTQPPLDRLHIIVRKPDTVPRPRSPHTPKHSAKRPRLEESEMLRTPPNATRAPSLHTQVTPPRLSAKEVEPAMLTALEPFTQYLTYLAEGKLDGYFSSIQPEDLVTDLRVNLPSPPMLLLHDLGTDQGKERIKRLFVLDTVHLFAVSGSGKTRLALEGLCHNWGFYFSCRGGSQKLAAGSCDFDVATEIMESMSKWDKRIVMDEADITKNVDVAHRAFAMLICARVFVLRHLLTKLPNGTDAMVARRRWVLAQVLPPSLPYGDDLFTDVVISLRSANTTDMLNLARTTLREMTQTVGKENFPNEPLFAVVDEAQVAAEYLEESFRSVTTGIDKRPVLHAFYRFLWDTGVFRGVILAGTGLSMKMVRTAGSSGSAKIMESRPNPIVFVEVGRFMKDGTDHESYIHKYLSLSPSSISDQRLMERILYWFSGRYRFTASLIELLLFTQPGSGHRVLSAFVESLTGFTITDAIDLEEGEPPLTADTLNRTQYYGQVSTADCLFEKSDGKHLIICLLHVLMRWRIGSQATSLPIEGNMHETVMLGVGHLEKIGPSQTLDPKINYPVYLCEPLVVLYLSSVFERHSWTTNEAWIADAFRTARNSSSLGFIFEEAVLLVLLQAFGGKTRALSDAFHCNQPWGSRKVTLVALKRRVDGVMQSCPVSWTSGSSDRLGFKATSPADVLKFLNNPDGKCFLFPDNHMGPDILCFLQDEETKELILVALQAKILKSFDARAWQSALDSITPQFFYTSNTKNGRVQYTPSAYPGLLNDIVDVLELMLGSAESKPVVDKYRKKLRSSTALDQQFASQPPRKTPHYLRIITTKEAHQRWKSECKGDVGVLRWELVDQYLGSTADVVMTGPPSVA